MDDDLYQPLDFAIREIRLFEFLYLESREQDSICGNLKMFPLDDAPKYAALNYIWGNNHDKVPIKVNSKMVKVIRSLSKGLAAFKRLIANTNEKKYIWANATCINQKNTAEKTS